MKTLEISSSLGDLLTDSCNDLTSLGEECREVAENMPESLQSGSRYEALSNSGDILTGLNDPSVPNGLSETMIIYQHFKATRSRPLSRAGRRDNAVMALQAAKGYLDGLEDNEDARQLSSDLDEIISEAEECEFPGMMG